MSSLTLVFLEKEYQIPKDVLVYIDLVDFTNGVQQQLMSAFSRKLGSSDSGFVTNQEFATDINQQVKRFIGKLCDYGIFNRTVNDYLKDNNGYQLISDVNKDAFSKSIDLMTQKIESWKTGYEDAMNKAESSITGMGFSIWSGSLINHALYAAMQASTIDKQEKAASKQYQKDMEALDAKLDSQFGKETSRYINNVYIPHMESSTMAFAYELLDRYLSDLIANNKFDAEALKYVDIERSNDLLENLSLSANKKAILEGAFMACPFNFAVYQNAMKYELLDYKSFKTAECFKQGDRLIAGLQENWGKVLFPTNFSINYPKIDQWATYTNQKSVDILRPLTETYATGVIKAYERVANMISTPDLCRKIVHENGEEAALKGDAVSKRKSHEYVNSIVSSDIWSQLVYKCGHEDLLDRVRTYISEDIEVKRKADADQYFIDQLYSLFEEIRQNWIVEINERKQKEAADRYELARIEEEKKAQLSQKRKERNKIIYILLIMAALIATFFAGMSFSKRGQAKEDIQAETSAGTEIENAKKWSDQRILTSKEKLEPYFDVMGTKITSTDIEVSQEFIDNLNNIDLMGCVGSIEHGFNTYSDGKTYIELLTWKSNETVTPEYYEQFVDLLSLFFDGVGRYTSPNTLLETSMEWSDLDYNCLAYSWYKDNRIHVAWDWNTNDYYVSNKMKNSSADVEQYGEESAILQKSSLSNTFSVGWGYAVGICSDGSVVVAGDKETDGSDVSDWMDIVAISAGDHHTIGLRSDGTVIATGYNRDGQCDVSEWTDIIAISAGAAHTIGLRADGTVLTTGANDNGECNVSTWSDIVTVSAGDYCTVGIHADGSVVTAGTNEYGQLDVSQWSNVSDISSGGRHTIGLRTDGTVVAAGYNHFGQCDLSEWSDIVAISAGQHHSVGLRADGTVVAVGYNSSGQCDVSEWENIVAIAANGSNTMGLCSDGTVVAVGYNESGECEVSSWRNIKTPN